MQKLLRDARCFVSAANHLPLYLEQVKLCPCLFLRLHSSATSPTTLLASAATLLVVSFTKSPSSSFLSFAQTKTKQMNKKLSLQHSNSLLVFSSSPLPFFHSFFLYSLLLLHSHFSSFYLPCPSFLPLMYHCRCVCSCVTVYVYVCEFCSFLFPPDSSCS